MKIAKGDKVISVEDVYKSFGNHQVLKGVNITVSKGENLVVLGKSGTGKSVLIKCLVALIPIDAGKIYIFDKDVTNADTREITDIRKRVGFLFQGAALYDSMSVCENLEFPLKRLERSISKSELNTRVEEALDNVGLLDAKYKMPAELSGGMRKRIGLARTIILNPEIILYDEPTTGLDTITSREISELILSLQEKYHTTSIIITHDMDCAKLTSNRIVILNEGKEIAEGTFEDLGKSDNPLIKSFFTSYY